MHSPKLDKQRISFDFDGTLHEDFDGTPNPQMNEIQNICKVLLKSGKFVCIITKRYGPNHIESRKVFHIANELGINEVHFTNREMKTQLISSLNIDCHFENDKYEVDSLSQYLPNTLIIDINDKYWRDLVY